jgi:hypothetical protein
MVGLRERSDDYLRIWILVRITRMMMTTTTMMRDTRRRLGFSFGLGYLEGLVFSLALSFVMYVMGFMSAYDQHTVLQHVLDDVYQCLTRARYKYSDILNTASNMYSHPLHVIMS